MRWITFIVVFGFLGSAWANTGVEGLRGEYPILEYNGDLMVSGVAQVIADANTVGVHVTGLPLASQPAAALSALSPVGTTHVSEEDSRIVQLYTDGRGSTRVEYFRGPGFLEIQTEVCREGDGCEANRLVVAQTASPGTPVGFEEFFEAHSGTYQIRLAGGSTPKPENEGALVDGTMGYLMLPYCQPGGSCNPGYIFVDSSNTQIYRREGAEFTQFVLVVSFAGDTKIYSWTDNDDGTVLVRDFQYRLNEARVCMEHVLTLL